MPKRGRAAGAPAAPECPVHVGSLIAARCNSPHCPSNSPHCPSNASQFYQCQAGGSKLITRALPRPFSAYHSPEAALPSGCTGNAPEATAAAKQRRGCAWGQRLHGGAGGAQGVCRPPGDAGGLLLHRPGARVVGPLPAPTPPPPRQAAPLASPTSSLRRYPLVQWRGFPVGLREAQNKFLRNTICKALPRCRHGPGRLASILEWSRAPITAVPSKSCRRMCASPSSPPPRASSAAGSSLSGGSALRLLPPLTPGLLAAAAPPTLMAADVRAARWPLLPAAGEALPPGLPQAPSLSSPPDASPGTVHVSSVSLP